MTKIQEQQKVEIEIRDAVESDLLMLYSLANESLVRQNSFNSKPISVQEHKEWYKNKLLDENSMIFIASRNQAFVGQIRFDLGDENVIGISISPEYRGLGLGSVLLTKGLAYLKKKRPEIKIIKAYIKDSNIASIKSFEKAGFTHEALTQIDGHRAVKLNYKID